MVITNQVKNQHLVWRAGFGASPEELQQLSTISYIDLYKKMEQASQAKPGYFDPAKNLVQGFFMGMGEVANLKQDNEQAKVKQREFAKQSRELIKSLNLTWINEMTESKAQLREKMALFWHGHFACRNLNIYFQQLLLHEIRTNALGNFGDLLMGVSKSAGMLAFLNNQQNRKSHPNENFAREVMELFTMGRGNYTEQDVKEAARAFTGWGFNLKGEFVFRRFQHDDGIKTILGKKGNFDGDDVIKLLLEQRTTASFITRKIYRSFVNDVPDEAHIQWLAHRFYQSNYRIDGLMSDIFTSTWFYDQKNIGSHIKSPVELLVGIRRLLPMQLQNEQVQLLMQRALGQVLFYPPNVAGWPGGKNWIDSSALVLRLRLPQLLAGRDVFTIEPKTDDDQQMGMMDSANGPGNTGKEMGFGNRFKLKAAIDWPLFMKPFEQVPRPKLYKEVEAVILQTAQSASLGTSVETVADSSSRENYIRSVAIALMSTPEYQLS